MRIGLKFCGGCNPYYERGKAVRRLEEAFPRFSFETARKGECYDAVLLICGCVRICVQHYREAEAGRYIVLRSPEEFETLASEMARWE